MLMRLAPFRSELPFLVPVMPEKLLAVSSILQLFAWQGGSSSLPFSWETAESLSCFW